MGALTDAACCDPARVVSCEQKIHEDFSLRISEEEKRLVAWGEGLIRGGMGSSGWLLGLFLGFTFLGTGGCIKCYQCSSTEDRRGTPDGVWAKDPYSQDRFEDSCGVYYPFQKERNIPVECNSDES